MPWTTTCTDPASARAESLLKVRLYSRWPSSSATAKRARSRALAASVAPIVVSEAMMPP